MKTVERNFHGRKLSIETGRLAKQANGSVIVRAGDSMVLVTACAGAAKDGDFLPLTIDYVEKAYAGGRIPGSYFRREAKLGEKETLTSRLIDRPCRPLFPEGFNIEIQVVATVVSADGENDTDVLAVCGASAALTLSDLPFQGPIAAVRVARVKGKLVINPTSSEVKDADLNFVVAGSADAIVMVEGGAAEATEQEVSEALFFAQQELQQIIQMQLELQKAVGKEKMTFERKPVNTALVESVKSFIAKPLNDAIRVKEKLARRDAIKALKEQTKEHLLKEGDPDAAKSAAVIEKTFEDELYYAVRKMVFTEKRRIDGRDFTTVRPITVEAGSLPRSHGSAVFTRGETQALVSATLGTKDDAQRMDSLVGETTKTFMLHYNFPAFSVGEVKPLRGPGRREVGHGALAERAVKYILPNEHDFPYVLRIVSEILESNGSSSMATVCGSSLALMDAGVPTKGQVAGVAMGLMIDGKNSVILTDILGDEDHLGDMDFKVCGTARGITALQMDIKIQGLERSLVEQALAQARDARLFILEQMNAILPAPRKNMSKHAPRIVTIKINPDKIRDLIGPGGKTIRSISDSCSVKIDVQDDGTVSVACSDEDRLQTALKIINGITEEAVIGKIYKGIIKRITDFGAFVEIIPGTEGLLHISQISDERIRKVTDVLNEGDDVVVKVLDVDRQGKIRLSRKEAMAEMGN